MSDLDLLRDLRADMPAANPTVRYAARRAATGQARSKRDRRRWLSLPVAGVAILTVAAGAAAAVHVLTPSQRESTILGCRLPEPVGDGVIGSVTGDPVTDCAAQWRIETGSDAPELLPYDNGHGAIDVLQAAEAPPAGYTLLPPGSAQDARLINLNETLTDYVDGLRSQCFSSEAAAARARAALDDVGLTDWSVTVDASTPAADGTLQCWGAAGRARDRTVVVQAQTTDQPNAEYMLLASRLRPDRDQCLDLSTAAAHVRADASELGIPDHNVQITEVPQTAARCTVIHETVGGRISIVLRGPNGSPRPVSPTTT